MIADPDIAHFVHGENIANPNRIFNALPEEWRSRIEHLDLNWGRKWGAAGGHGGHILISFSDNDPNAPRWGRRWFMLHRHFFVTSTLLFVFTTPNWADLPVESWGLAPHYEKWAGRLKRADPYAMMEVWASENKIGCDAAQNKHIKFLVLAKPLIIAECEKKVPLALYYRSVLERVENPNSSSYLSYLIQAAQLGEPLALDQLEQVYDQQNDVVKRNNYSYQAFLAYKKLAEGGNLHAMVKLAFSYISFLPTGTITKEEMKNWLQKAFNAGSIEAREYIARDKLASDKLEDQMVGIDICKKLYGENNYWGTVILAQYYLEHNSPDKAIIWANKAKALVGCETMDVQNILDSEPVE